MTQPQDVAAIEQREYQLYAALTASDAVALDELLAEDFRDHHHAGLTTAKETYLTGHRSRVFLSGLIERVSGYTWSNGQAGITAGHIVVQPHATKSGDPLTLVQTLLWVNQGGVWRILLRQTTKTTTAIDVAPGNPALVGGTAPVESVEAQELAFYAAQTSSDVAKLSEVMSDSLSWFVHAGSGSVDNKSRYLRNVANGRYGHGPIHKIHGKTHVLGNVAASIGTIDMDCIPGDSFRFSMRIDHVLLWALEASGWKLICRHATKQPL
jgi:ketosteroid isomerase-like protein